MSDKKVYAMAGADCETAGGLPQGYPFLVLREYDSGFIFIDETGTELYGLWKGCCHLHGADWTRLELEESEADEKRTIAQGLQSDPIDTHPNSEPDADQYSVGADTIDDSDDQPPRSKYHREIAPSVWVDVYDVLRAWSVTNPALQHLIKKALAPGERGHKTLEQDMEDIVASAKRARELV